MPDAAQQPLAADGSPLVKHERPQLKRVLEILSQTPVSVSMTWEAIHRGLNLTLEEPALLGADYFGLAATTEDFREGTKSFLEKTKRLFAGNDNGLGSYRKAG